MSERINYPGDWAGQGVCREVDPELFFADKPDVHTNNRAKSICRACPVVGECLEWALDNERHGVWGGTTPDEREAFRKKSWFREGLRRVLNDHEAKERERTELDRRIVSMRRQGMQNADVAAALGMKKSTVEKRIERMKGRVA